MTRNLFLLVSCGLLAACSGGSGGGTPTTTTATASNHVIIDTVASTDAVITGRVQVVAFERVDGTFTENLLLEETTVVLTDPDGSPSALPLRDVPAGSYVAMRWLIVPGSVTERSDTGETGPLRLPSFDVRVPFAEAQVFPDTAAPLVTVRHEGPIDIVPDATGKVWRIRLEAERREILPVRLARLDVIDLGPPVRAEAASMAEIKVTLSFEPDAILVREPFLERLTVEDFVAGLEIGSRLLVDGFLSGDLFTVISAVDVGTDPDDGEPGGHKGEVIGEILEIDADDEVFVMSIQEVIKGGNNLPDPTPERIRVDASDAKIKYVPRHGRHRGHLDFDALAVGQRVKVSWHGPVEDDGSVPADKVDIRSDASRRVVRVEGEVLSIDSAARELELEVDHISPESGRKATLILVVTEHTCIVTEADKHLVRIGFSDIEVDDEIEALGELGEDRRLVATLIVVDD